MCWKLISGQSTISLLNEQTKQTLSFWLKTFTSASLLCLSRCCLAHERNITFHYWNIFEHITMVFSTFKIIVLFPIRVVGTEEIYVYSACPEIHFGNLLLIFELGIIIHYLENAIDYSFCTVYSILCLTEATTYPASNKDSM